jgi:hypothetical protein
MTHASTNSTATEHKAIEQIAVDAGDQSEVIETLIETCYELVERNNELEERVTQLEKDSNDHEARMGALGKGISNINDTQADHEERLESIETNVDDDPDTTHNRTQAMGHKNRMTTMSPPRQILNKSCPCLNPWSMIN